MAINRTTPVNIPIGTSGGTSGLFGLGASATACSQSDQVTSSVTNNLTNIIARGDILLPTFTPAAGLQMNIFVWGTNDDSGFPGGSATTEVITGSAGLITLSALGNNAPKFLTSITGLTTGITQKWEGSVVAALGFVPRRWGLVFMNQIGVTLPTTGHSAEYIEEYYN